MGAFFVIRRSAIPGDKLFDEDFFFYFEDNDLAHRLLDAGVICYALPKYHHVHLGGSSTSVEGARVFYRSKNLYLKKHYSDSFARMIMTLDRFRLRMKFIKYSLLSIFSSSQSIAHKKAHYTAMRHAADLDGTC